MLFRSTGRNVYLQPSLASQGVKGTVTNALASAFVGSLGGGKSFCNNLLVYYSVLFGGQAVILDPKSERGNWKETLPEIAEEINIVNLTSDKENAGLLDPFVIMKDKEDGATLAKEILTFLTGISTRDGDKFPVLISAISKVSESEHRGLLNVITELRKENTPIANHIANHIDSFTNYDFAHLLFSDGTAKNTISLDNQLNIIQVADLVLPDKDTTFDEYTTIELLSVDFESTGDFVFQQFFHLRITVDFIIAHGNKVIHQRVPYLIQKLTECQKYRFFDVLQIDFVLCDHELESQKETVIHLIVAYHRYKGFGLVVYFLIGDFL